MTTLFTDDFNRADGGVGGNYTTGGPTGGMSIVSNEVNNGSGGTWASYYSGGAVPDDQWAQAKMVDTGPGVDAGPAVTLRHAGNNAYWMKCSPDYTRIERVSGSTHTFLFGTATLIADGDTAYLEVVGDDFIAKKNGSSISTGSDATYTSGAFGFGAMGGGILDDFEGGDFASGTDEDFVRVDETDTASALVGEKSGAFGLPSETDTASALTGEKSSAIVRADETDTALPLTGLKSAAWGLCVETDTASALTGIKSSAFELAIETDTAIALATAAAFSVQHPGMRTNGVTRSINGQAAARGLRSARTRRGIRTT